jgi:hypothetical protein
MGVVTDLDTREIKNSRGSPKRRHRSIIEPTELKHPAAMPVRMMALFF